MAQPKFLTTFIKRLFTVAVLTSTSQLSLAQVVTEPDDQAYHFTSHYRITIDAPSAQVWPHLINLGSWMFEFAMEPISGEPGKSGQVYQLYPQQNFYMQITKLIPNELLVMVNLPSLFAEEHSTGIGVISLAEANEKTFLHMTMSRRYTWEGQGINPSQETRESNEFVSRTDAMWQDRFLLRLKTLSEDRPKP